VLFDSCGTVDYHANEKQVEKQRSKSVNPNHFRTTGMRWQKVTMPKEWQPKRDKTAAQARGKSQENSL